MTFGCRASCDSASKSSGLASAASCGWMPTVAYTPFMLLGQLDGAVEAFQCRAVAIADGEHSRHAALSRRAKDSLRSLSNRLFSRMAVGVDVHASQWSTSFSYTRPYRHVFQKARQHRLAIFPQTTRRRSCRSIPVRAACAAQGWRRSRPCVRQASRARRPRRFPRRSAGLRCQGRLPGAAACRRLLLSPRLSPGQRAARPSRNRRW